MGIQFYERHLKSLFDVSATIATDSFLEGSITVKESGKTYQIRKSIPRFLESADNYSESFGFQWGKFRQTQLDSYAKLNLTKNRFFSCSEWTPGEIFGKHILEVGSGAGRFTEILLEAGAIVYSVDYSNAVEANYLNNGKHPNLFLFQADVYEIPFPNDYFDFVFCYGVLQHTPNPDRSFAKIFAKLKPTGKISVDYYLKPDHPTVWATPKYFWRPLTVKIPASLLLRVIRLYLFFWFPFDTMIKLLPFNLGYRILARVPLPCYNYLGSGLHYWQRFNWAVLDTFDALSAQYDLPKTKDEVEQMISRVSFLKKDVFLGGNGVVANLIKK